MHRMRGAGQRARLFCKSILIEIFSRVVDVSESGGLRPHLGSHFYRFEPLGGALMAIKLSRAFATSNLSHEHARGATEIA